MNFTLRYRLGKLPDKGQKIQLLYDRAVKALEMKNEIEVASSLLSALNLGANDINNLEWEGKTNGCKPQDVLDSDDDEDPLAILTSSNSVSRNQIIVKHSRDDGREAQLITEEDIKEALEAHSPLHLDPVLEHICQNEKMEPSHRFLPHKPKFSSLNSSSSSLASLDEHKKIRDNSAASPPVYLQGTKLLTLRESIETQHAQRLVLKGLQEKQAVDRLAMRVKEQTITSQPTDSTISQKKPDASFMSKYRLANSLLDDFEVEENDSLSDENDDDEN